MVEVVFALSHVVSGKTWIPRLITTEDDHLGCRITIVESTSYGVSYLSLDFLCLKCQLMLFGISGKEQAVLTSFSKGVRLVSFCRKFVVAILTIGCSLVLILFGLGLEFSNCQRPDVGIVSRLRHFLSHAPIASLCVRPATSQFTNDVHAIDGDRSCSLFHRDRLELDVIIISANSTNNIIGLTNLFC